MIATGILFAAPLVHADSSCSTFDVACNLQNGLAQFLAATINTMISWAASALGWAVDSSAANQSELDDVNNVANALFNNLAVAVIVGLFFYQLIMSGFRMKLVELIYALGRAVGAVFLFRIVLYLLANKDWSIILMFDQITTGMMKGLGVNQKDLTNSFSNLLGTTPGQASDPTGFVQSFLKDSVMSSMTPAASTLQGVLAVLLIILIFVGIIWFLAFIFSLVMTLRLLGILVIGASLPFMVMFMPLQGSGKKVMSRWVKTLFALLAAKPLAIIIIAMGVSVLNANSGKSFNFMAIMAAVIMLALASFSPLMSMKFFGWLDLESHAQGGSGGQEHAGKAVPVAGARAAVKTGMAIVSKGKTIGNGGGGKPASSNAAGETSGGQGNAGPDPAAGDGPATSTTGQSERSGAQTSGASGTPGQSGGSTSSSGNGPATSTTGTSSTGATAPASNLPSGTAAPGSDQSGARHAAASGPTISGARSV